MPDKHTVIIIVVKENGRKKRLTSTRTVYAFDPIDIIRPLEETMDHFAHAKDVAYAPGARH